ncbi:FAD-binding oxidoreductase [Zhongshania marina]|uniref:Oxidoreductase n=1 Tax=Zhongshania marina TaxID=2304603 RepID=A0ABX9VXX0_9GAMM|nr:oxidoreductase [Zhongshania marina]
MSSININNKIIIPSENGDSILRSALRNFIGIPYECNSGGCGACKVDLIYGEVKNTYPDSVSISDRDRRKNRVLACQSIPLGDVEIGVEFAEIEGGLYRPGKCTGVLMEKEYISTEVVEFSFSLKNDVKYMPGQYFMISIPGVGERAYSVSSPDSDDGVIKFIVKKMNFGKFSSYLFNDFNVNDNIILDGPYGHAYFLENERDIVCIAGGAGLSPIVSIVRRMEKSRSDNNLYFFYGVNQIDEINSDYISNLLKGIPASRCDFIPAITSRQEDWQGEVGYIHEVVSRCLEDFSDKEFYFCGPPVMTSAVQKLLMIEKSVPYERMHFDRFF